MAIDRHTITEHINDIEDDEWILDTDQMIFMLQYHNAIEAAFDADDDGFFEALEQSEAFRSIFGEMTFDEAYDRYECMMEADNGNPSVAS